MPRILLCAELNNQILSLMARNLACTQSISKPKTVLETLNPWLLKKKYLGFLLTPIHQKNGKEELHNNFVDTLYMSIYCDSTFTCSIVLQFMDSPF
jgi:hypothetical protein